MAQIASGLLSAYPAWRAHDMAWYGMAWYRSWHEIPGWARPWGTACLPCLVLGGSHPAYTAHRAIVGAALNPPERGPLSSHSLAVPFAGESRLLVRLGVVCPTSRLLKVYLSSSSSLHESSQHICTGQGTKLSLLSKTAIRHARAYDSWVTWVRRKGLGRHGSRRKGLWAAISMLGLPVSGAVSCCVCAASPVGWPGCSGVGCSGGAASAWVGTPAA